MPADTKRNRCAIALMVCAVVALAGCGGGGSKNADVTGNTTKASQHAKGKAAIGKGDVTVQKSLLGAGVTASAGTEQSYEPTGDIIADSGFRPQANGFAFENYGNDVQPQNMTTGSVLDLFGPDVCIGGDDKDCRLTPAARRWMTNENARMNGGHCMGFSVSAIRMYEFAQNGKTGLDPTDYGANKPIDLQIQGNTDLQSTIAENWVYQDLPDITDNVVQGTPTHVLEKLADALNSGKEDYTLAILMADGTGGHAITPFAIEDKGDGTYAILVYDNNFPGITRAVQVDTNKDTWRYVGGINPKDLSEVYEGDADTQSMMLYPTTPVEGFYEPCPFCDGGGSGSGGSNLGSTGGRTSVTGFQQITLGGAVTNHPHLVLTDEKGRQTGIVGGKLLRQIPGVQVDLSFSVRNWEASPEPRYRVPKGLDVTMTIDGSDLKKPATSSIDLIGNGLVVAIDTIKIAPDQKDNVYISGDGYGLYYESNGKGEEAPELYAGVDTAKASYTFAASAVGIKSGSTIGLLVDKKSGTVLLDSDGTKGTLDGKALFILVVNKQTATRTFTWARDDFQLDGRRKDQVIFDYHHTPAAGKPLDVLVGPQDGESKVRHLPWSP